MVRTRVGNAGDDAAQQQHQATGWTGIRLKHLRPGLAYGKHALQQHIANTASCCKKQHPLRLPQPSAPLCTCPTHQKPSAELPWSCRSDTQYSLNRAVQACTTSLAAVTWTGTHGDSTQRDRSGACEIQGSCSMCTYTMPLRIPLHKDSHLTASAYIIPATCGPNIKSVTSLDSISASQHTCCTVPRVNPHNVLLAHTP